MRSIFLITKNILKRIIKHPTNILLYFLLPVVSSIALFFLVGLDSEGVVYIAFSDLDHSFVSASIREKVEASDLVIVDAMSNRADEMIVNREVAYSITIPDGFEEDLKNDVTSEIIVKSIDENMGTLQIKNSINYYVNYAKKLYTILGDTKLVKEQMSKTPLLELSSLVLKDEYKEKSATERTFGVYLLLIMLTTFTVAFKLITSKRDGTYQRIGYAPVHPKSYILSNILANIIITAMQIAVVLLILSFGLKVNFYVNPIKIFLIILSFSLVSISVGVLIAISSKDMNNATGILGLILSPTSMIAGCLYPLDFMPEYMRRIAYIMPQRWALDAIMKVQINGTMISVLPHLTVIFGFVILFFLLSVYKMQTIKA